MAATKKAPSVGTAGEQAVKFPVKADYPELVRASEKLEELRARARKVRAQITELGEVHNSPTLRKSALESAARQLMNTGTVPAETERLEDRLPVLRRELEVVEVAIPLAEAEVRKALDAARERASKTVRPVYESAVQELDAHLHAALEAARRVRAIRGQLDELRLDAVIPPCDISWLVGVDDLQNESGLRHWFKNVRQLGLVREDGEAMPDGCPHATVPYGRPGY